MNVESVVQCFHLQFRHLDPDHYQARLPCTLYKFPPLCLSTVSYGKNNNRKREDCIPALLHSIILTNAYRMERQSCTQDLPLNDKTVLYLTNKETYAVYYTVIKHYGHFRIRGKCRKHEPRASSQVFSIVRSVLSQCNTRHLLYDIEVMLQKTINMLFLCFIL